MSDNAFPARELASTVFPCGEPGVFVMLRAFFDDSGTHANSDMVVWGGIFAPGEFLYELEERWAAFLAEPVEGLGPIKKWSARDCRRGDGEFLGWSQGAKDRARYRAREVIRESAVVPIAYAVPAKVYESVFRGRARRAFGSASGIAFASCADMGLQLAESRNEPVACVFDQGQKSPWLDMLLDDNIARAASKQIPISHTYAPVLGSYGLQAADNVATEAFWWGLRYLQEENPQPDPHEKAFQELLDPRGLYLHREQMEEMRTAWLRDNPIRNWVLRKG